MTVYLWLPWQHRHIPQAIPDAVARNVGGLYLQPPISGAGDAWGWPPEMFDSSARTNSAQIIAHRDYWFKRLNRDDLKLTLSPNGLGHEIIRWHEAMSPDDLRLSLVAWHGICVSLHSRGFGLDALHLDVENRNPNGSVIITDNTRREAFLAERARVFSDTARAVWESPDLPISNYRVLNSLVTYDFRAGVSYRAAVDLVAERAEPGHAVWVRVDQFAPRQVRALIALADAAGADAIIWTGDLSRDIDRVAEVLA